jgi:hypothetical protein
MFFSMVATVSQRQGAARTYSLCEDYPRSEQELRKNQKNTSWNIPVPRVLDEALEEAVKRATHSTKSDFVRDAVRRRLEDMGFKANPFLEAKPVSGQA